MNVEKVKEVFLMETEFILFQSFDRNKEMDHRPRCSATTNKGTQCSRYALPYADMCQQHWKIRNAHTNMIPDTPKPMERIEEMSLDDDHPCSICFEYTSEKNDALFKCSLYAGEGGKCILCVTCADQLRKLKCPHCNEPISATEKFTQSYIDAIKARSEEDMKERRIEDSRPPTVDEIQAALNSGETDVLEIPQPSEGSPEWDSMLGFASQLLMYGTVYEVVHEMMHRRYPGIGIYRQILCETIDTVIVNAQNMLGFDE